MTKQCIQSVIVFVFYKDLQNKDRRRFRVVMKIFKNISNYLCFLSNIYRPNVILKYS